MIRHRDFSSTQLNSVIFHLNARTLHLNIVHQTQEIRALNYYMSHNSVQRNKTKTNAISLIRTPKVEI